jgi:sugar lactone lactonase YvrE
MLCGSARQPLLVDSQCTLGEGIVWDAKRGALFWTDIENSQLWMRVVATGETQSWSLPERVGALAIGRSGRVLLGFEKRLCLVDVDSVVACSAEHARAYGCRTHRAHTRVNDGRTDRSGNFVFGTLNEAEDKARIGGFYQYSIKHGLRRLSWAAWRFANSICFSPDGGTMYYCDSLTMHHALRLRCGFGTSHTHPGIRRFAYDAGLPDGSVIARGRLTLECRMGIRTSAPLYTPVRRDMVIDVPAGTRPVLRSGVLGTVTCTSRRHGRN